MKINQHKYVAIIPARKGSKRLKNKNLIKLNRKTLFDYTFDAAIKCNKISKIIVSTNIPRLIKKNSNRIFYIKRPKYLCEDHCTTESAIKHALKIFENCDKKKINNIILLQPTSPLRNFTEINNAIKVYEKFNYDSLLSVYKEKLSLWEEKGSTPYPQNYKINRRIRGQFMKETIVENGAIYIFKREGFSKFNNRLFGNIGLSAKNADMEKSKEIIDLYHERKS